MAAFEKMEGHYFISALLEVEKYSSSTSHPIARDDIACYAIASAQKRGFQTLC